MFLIRFIIVWDRRIFFRKYKLLGVQNFIGIQKIYKSVVDQFFLGFSKFDRVHMDQYLETAVTINFKS